MYYIEFYLVRRDLYAMTNEERAKMMDNEFVKAEEERKAGVVYRPPECVFPEWLVSIFKSLSHRYRYEPMNQIARVFFVTTGERETAANNFEKVYKSLLGNKGKNPSDMDEFMAKFQVMTGMFDNTVEAIAIDEDLQEEFAAEAEDKAKRLGLNRLPTWQEALEHQKKEETEVKVRRVGALRRAWRWLFGDPEE